MVGNLQAQSNLFTLQLVVSAIVLVGNMVTKTGAMETTVEKKSSKENI